MNKLIIIDGNNLAHRAHHKFNFSTSEGVPSSIAYGFFYILSSLIKKFSANQVSIAFDGGRSPYRTDAHPEYKEGRASLGLDKDSFYNQLNDVKEVAPSFGCKVFYKRHHEADDLIYRIVKTNPDTPKTIVSSDKDFIQLLGISNLTVFNPFRDKIISILNCKDEYGFDYDEFVDYLILKGDKSDNIPGVRGMGDVRIRAFLQEWGSIETFIESRNTYWGNYNIEEAWDRNRPLIDLRYFHLKNPSIIRPRVGDFNPEKIRLFARKYQAGSLAKDSFLKVFQNLRNYNESDNI